MTRKRATLLAGLLALGGRALALPEGGQVQAGNVQTHAAGSTMTIQQMSDRAIINWNGFSIGANELVNVLQPNQAAILLNRVVGQDPSQILGQLNANGNIWLLNPNGILFGAGAQINVGGLLASTLNLSDRDFLAGKYNFTQSPDKPLASVVNQGELHIAPNGYLILAAPLVSNEGLIVANLGKVAMLAGDQMSISLDSQGLINYRLAQAGPNAGPVLLSPDMVSDVLKSVVQRGEIAEANIITQSDGKVWLGNGSGVAIQAGTIQAPGLVIDSQKETLLRPESLITVNNGGEAKILSQGVTWAQTGSKIEAPNASVELSGHRLAASGSVNLGQSGRLLLDPDFLTIVPGSGDLDQNPIGPSDNPGGSSTIGTDFLAGIKGGNIVLQAENTITVAALPAPLILSSDISMNLTAVSGDVIFADVNTAIVASGSANIGITAGRDIVLGQLQTDQGGSVLLSAGRDILSAGALGVGQANVRTGHLDLTANNNVSLSTASTGQFASLNLNSANVGNLTLVNDGRLDVAIVNATENSSISTIANVSPKPDLNVHGPVTAGNSATFDSAGDLIVDVNEFVTTIIAPDVVLRATGDVVAQLIGEPEGIADFVSSTNLAVVAGNQIRGTFNVSTSNIALQAGSSASVVLDGGAQITSFAGVNGASVTSPGGHLYLEADSGDLRVNAPVTASFLDLETFFSGSITQGVGGVIQTDDLTIGSDVNADVTFSSLTVASPNLYAFASGNLSVNSGNSTTVFNFDSSNGDARLNVNGDIDLETPVFAQNLVSINATGDFRNGNQAPIAFGDSLALRAATISGNPIATQVNVLAADTGSSLDVSQGGLLQVGSVDGLNGIHSNGNVTLTADPFGGESQGPPISGLQILAPISAQNVTLNANSVDLLINSPTGAVTGATGVEINVSSGRLDMTGQAVASPVAVINVDGPIAGTGSGNLLVDNLTMSSSFGAIAASGGAFSAANQTVTLHASSDLNYTSANSTVVSAANVTDGDVHFQVTGDLAASTAIRSTGLVEIHASGTLSADTVFAQTPRLLLDVGDQTSQLRINTGQLAALSGGNLNLIQAGGLDVGDVGALSGVSATGAVTVVVENGGLVLDSAIFAPTVNLQVGGNLDAPVAGPAVFASDLTLNVNSQGDGILHVATQRLVASSNDSMTLDVTSPSLDLQGGTVVNNLNLTSSNGLTVSGPVHGGNVTLQANSGNITLQAPAPDAAISADHNVSLTAGSGRISMTDLGVAAENVSLVSSGNIIGTPILLPNVFADRVNIDTTGGNTSLAVEGFTPPPPGLLLNSTLNVTSTGNVTVRSTASDLNVEQLVNGGDVRLSGPNDIAVNSTITSPGLISVTAGGNLLDFTSGVLFDADRLAVRANGVSGNQLRTHANTLAGRFTSDVELIQNTALTIGLVDGVNGLQSTGNLLLSLGGATQINQSVQAQNVTVNMGPGADLTVNSPAPGLGGTTGVEINMAGGNLSLNGNAVASPVAVLAVNETVGNGPGNLLADSLTVTSSGNFTASGGAFSPSTAQTLDILSSGNVSYASANTTVVSQLTSTAGNVNLSVAGDLNTFSPITAADVVNVSLTGSPTAAGVFAQAPRLALDAGDVSTQLLVETGTLAARSGNNLNLAQSTGDLTVGNVVGFLDGLSATKDVNLAVSTNLQLDSPITAQTVGLQVSGNLVNTQSAPAVRSNALNVQVGSQTGAPLTVDTRNLTVQSNANMTVDATGTLNLVGGNVLNNLTLTGNSDTNVTGPVSAGNINLTLSAGNLSLQSPTTALQGAQQVNLRVNNGELAMTGASIAAPSVDLQTSGNISGSAPAPNVRADSVTVVSSAGGANFTVGNLSLAPVSVGASTLSDLALTSVSDLSLNSASSATGNILLDVTGNMALNGAVQAPTGLMTINVSGTLTNLLAVPAILGDRLALTVGDLNGNILQTDVHTLTADSNGNLTLAQATPLTIGGAAGLGLHATNNATLFLSGETTIVQPALAQNLTINMSGANLTVNTPSPGLTGTSNVNITTSGGNLTLVGTAISTPSSNLNLGGDLLGLNGSILADSLTIASTGTVTGHGGAFSAPSQTVSLSATNDLNYTSDNSTIISSASSSAGNVNLSVTGNVSALTPITSPDLVNVTVTGSPSASGVFASSPRLSLNVGDNSGPLTINTGLLAGTSAGNLNLVQAAPLTVGTIGAQVGLQSGNALNLTTGDLRLDSPVTGSAVNLHVGGVLTSNQTIPSVTGGSLFVDLAQDSANPITVDVRTLSGRSDGNLTVSSTGRLDVISSNVTNNFNLTGNGDTRVLSTVQAGNITIDVGGANLTTASSRTGTALRAADTVDLRAGAIDLVGSSIAAPTVTMQAAGNITGSLSSPQVLVDNLNASSSTGALLFSYAPFSLAQTTANLSAAGNIAVDSGSMVLQSASTVTGDILLDVTGNLQLDGALQSPGLMSVNVTGILANNVAGPAAIGNQLALRVGDYTGTPLQTQVNTLAASTGGNLSLSQSTPLTIDTVNGLNGISAAGDVLLVLGGETQINRAVNGQNVTVQMTGANLTINASPGLTGSTGVEVDMSGGNLSLNGTGIAAPIVALSLSNDFAGATGGILADQLIVNSGGNFSGQGSTLTPGATQGVLLNSVGNLTYVSPGSLNVSAANSSSGNVTLDVNGFLNVVNPITAADLVTINVTGSPSVAGIFVSAPRLALQSGDISSPLTLNVGTLAASGSNNLSFFQSSPLTIGTIGSLVGVSATKNLSLTTLSDLRLDSPLTAQTVTLNVGGQLDNTQSAPAVVANTLNLNEASQSASPLTLDVRNLSAHSNSSLNLAGTGTLNVQAANATNNVTLGGSSETTVSGPIQAANITLNQSSGNVTLNSPTPALQGSQRVDVNLANGNLTMVGPSVASPTVSLQASGGIQSSGAAPSVQANQLSVGSSGGGAALSFAPLTLPQTTVTASVFGNLALSSANTTFLQQASSSNGDVSVDITGNLRLDGPVQSPGVMSVNVTGTLANNVTGPAAIGNQLALRIGDYTGTPLQTQVNTLAASTGGNLSLSQSTPLTIDTVNGLNGISAAGDVLLVLGGETQINRAVNGQNVTVQMTGANLTINASPGLTGSTGVEVDMSGGNLSLNGTGIAAPVVALSLSNDFAGATGGILADQLIVNSGGNFSGQGSTFSQPTQTVTLNSVGNLSYVSPSSLTVSAANSSSGNVSLDVTGNLNVLSPITAADLVSVSVTGSPSASGIFASAPRLALQSGDISSPLNLNVGTLAASGSNNLNFFQASPLTVGTIGSLVGVSTANTLTLTTGSDLQLDSPLTAQTVVLNVGGQLNNNLASPAVVANTLNLNEASQSASPLTLDVRNLTAHSDSSLNLAGTGTLNVQAANATNNVTLGGSSETTVSGPIQAANITLNQSSGNVTLNSPTPALQGNQRVDVNLANGNLTMVGPSVASPTVSLQSSGGIQSSGAAPSVQANQLAVGSSAGGAALSFAPLSLPQTTVTASTFGNLALSSANTTFLQQASSSTGDVSVNINGNLRLDGPVQSPGVMSVNATGTLTNNNFGPAAIGNQLALRVGDLNGQPLETQVNVLAASTQGNLTVSQSTPLTVGSVDGLNGISAVGNVSLLLGGETQINAPVSGQNVSVGINGANLTINSPGLSGSTGVQVATSGGNLTLNGTAISAPTVALNLGNDFAGSSGGILADNLIVNSGGNFSGQGSTFSQPTQTVTLNSVGNLSYVSPSSLTVSAANSSSGNVSLDVTGNLNVLNPITAADLISVSVTGSPSASGIFAQAPRLALQAGDVSSPLSLNVGTLAASSSNNLNLFQASPLTVGTVGSLVGASAQNALTLTTGSDLRLDSPLTAQTVTLNVGGQLNNTQSSPAVVSNSLALNLASQSANPLTVNTRSLSGQSSGNLSLSATGTLDLQSLNVANNLTVSGDSNTLVSGPVQAGNVSLTVANGDLSVSGASQPTLVAANTVNLQVPKGSLSLAGQALSAPQVLLSVSGNVQGSGTGPNIQTDQLTYQSPSGNFDASLDHLTQQATSVSANTTGNVTFSSPHDLSVAASANNLSISTPGNLTATDTLRGTQSVTLQVGNTLSSTAPGPVVSSPLLNLQAGNTGRLNLDVDALSAVGTTLSFVFDRPNFELQNIQATDLTVSVTGSLLVTGPVSATNLSLSSVGNMNLAANSLTATTAVLTAGGNLNPSGQTDMHVQNLRLNVDGSVGSDGHPLQLAGSTTIAGHVGGSAYVQGETGLTTGTVAGASGFSAGALPGGGPKGIPSGQTLQLSVNQGNLQLDQNVTAANGTVFLFAPNGSIQGNGVVLSQDLAFLAGQTVNIFTDVNAIAGTGGTVTITETDQFTLDGLTLAGIGAFTGITGGVVTITAQSGNINLFDPSLQGLPGVNATISSSIIASNGSIFGGPGGVNVQSPVANFQASGSVGTQAVPVLIPRDSDFNSTNPFFVQVYPPLPPSPVLEVIIPAGDISEALAATGNVTLTDATSLGVTVGTLPSITLRALGARNDPAALVQISWNIPGEDGGGGTQTFRRPYLLDFSLEQLLSQPVNSRFLSLTLEELLNQPVISPMLEKTLEELLQEDLSGD